MLAAKAVSLRLADPMILTDTIGGLTGPPVPHLSRGGHLYKRASAELYAPWRHETMQPQASSLSSSAFVERECLERQPGLSREQFDNREAVSFPIGREQSCCRNSIPLSAKADSLLLCFL